MNITNKNETHTENTVSHLFEVKKRGFATTEYKIFG